MSDSYGPDPLPASRFRYWPAVVPLVGCAAIWLLMRPDAIAARPDVPYQLKWLLYDESDLTALALRGANAHAGRLPGRLDEPVDPVLSRHPITLEELLDGPQPPLADRFYLEYPTPALGLFWLGYAAAPGKDVALPPVLADAQQFSVGFFEPRNDTELAIWTRLGWAVRFYVAVMSAGLVGLIVVLTRGYGPGLDVPGPVWLCVFPGAVFFTLNRFDVLPALATALSIACLGRGRRGWAGAWLAVGVMMKVYPVLFVPIILRYLGPRDGVRWLIAFGATLAVGFGLAWAATDWQGVVGPIRVQMSRVLEERSWTLYGRVLPLSLGHSSKGRLAILAVAVLAASATRPRDLAGVLRRCAAVLVVFVNLAVFWSPQWIVWFLPLVVPVARGRPALISATVALDLLNYFTFPILFWILWHQTDEIPRWILAEGLVYTRAAAWAALAVALVWDERRSGRIDPAADFRERLPQLVEAFRKTGEQSGRPRGLAWVSATATGEPLFTTDAKTGRLMALLPVEVRFEPLPGSELEDVPQAREPRPVTAIFVAVGRDWHTDGRAVFNLSPAQVISKMTR